MKKLWVVVSLLLLAMDSTGSPPDVTPVVPMVTYQIKAPNGKTYEVQARQGASQLEIAQAVVEQHPEANIAKPVAGKIVTYEVTTPSGKTYDIEAPVGAPLADLQQAVLVQHPEAAIPRKNSTVKAATTGGTYKVALPNGQIVEFPNTVSDDEAASIIKKQFPEFSANPKYKALPEAPDVASLPATPSKSPNNTSFNESVFIGLVLGVLLWLAGRWQWRKLNCEPDNAGKAKLEGAKNFFFATLGVDLVATSGVIASYAWALGTLKDMSSGLVTADQSLISRLSALDSLFWVLIVTTIGVGVGLVKWLHASYFYAKDAIGATGFKQDGFEKSFAWFVPLYNLFKPYQIINEIYRISASGYELPDGWKKESWSGPLLTWWIFWAFIHFIWWTFSLILKKSKPTDFSIGTIEFQTWILVTSVLVALLWFVVAGSLTRRLMNRPNSVTVASIAPSHQTTNFERVTPLVLMPDSTPSTPKPQGTTSNEETIYEQALYELSTNKTPGLWAMALAQTANGGNPDGAYIALRVEQLRGERSERK
jgi:hypothetical protein